MSEQQPRKQDNRPVTYLGRHALLGFRTYSAPDLATALNFTRKLEAKRIRTVLLPCRKDATQPWHPLLSSWTVELV